VSTCASGGAGSGRNRAPADLFPLPISGLSRDCAGICLRRRTGLLLPAGSTAPTTTPQVARLGALRQGRRAFELHPAALLVNALTSAFTQFVPSAEAQVYDGGVGPRGFPIRPGSTAPTKTSVGFQPLGRYGKAAGLSMIFTGGFAACTFRVTALWRV